MINYNNLLKLNPFGLKKQKKNSLFFLAQKNFQFFIIKILTNIKKLQILNFHSLKKLKNLKCCLFYTQKFLKHII